MRALIRPTLFMIARLGLFLAVAAWIVGQFYYLQTGAGYIHLTVSRNDCEAEYRPVYSFPPYAHADKRGPEFVMTDVNDYDGFYFQASSNDERTSHGSFFIGEYAVYFNGHARVSIHHWLTITVAALFYILLKFIYRQKTPSSGGEKLMTKNRLQRLLLIALICDSAGCGKTTQIDAPEAAQTTQDGHSAVDATEAPQVINEIPDVVVENGFWAKVIGVVDGDTIDVLTRDRKTIRLRLNGVDCPEKGQPFGNNATEFTSKRIAGELVRVIIMGKPDRYGRLIADVYDENDQFHNMELVRFGFAWHYEKYAPDREDLST